MRFLDVTLDTYQDTSRYMYLGLFITIHQDTPRYKNKIHVSWTRHDDTIRIERTRDTLGIHEGYMQDTCKIHAGYMYLKRFEDTFRIYMQDTLKINQRYMRDNVSGRVIKIHSGYIRDT